MPRTRTLVATLSLLGCSMAVAGCKSAAPGGAGLPKPVIDAKPDLVGFTTSLDGSASKDPAGRALSYKWRFAGVPQGSKVNDGSLSAATSAQTTFEPDLGGTYTITLRVQAGDDVNEVTKAVEVPTWPVYFSDGNITPAGTSQSFNVIRSDGTGARPLSCVYSVDMGSPQGGGENGPLQAVAISGFGSLATYESGDDPLIAFPQYSFFTDTNGRFRIPFQMFVGSSRSDCMTRPASRVDTLAPVVLGAGNTSFYLFTRFSPNGRRISFLAIPQGSGGKSALVTVGIDGRDMRIVTDKATMIPPTWIDDTTIAYAEESTTSGFLIKKATDTANGGLTATTVHDCSGASPPFLEIGQFEIRGTTIVIAGKADSAAPVTIHRNTLGTCAAAPFVTTEAGAVALDFSISPDGKTMLFASSTGYEPLDLGGSFVNRLTDIWSIPVDGSSAPRKLAGDPMLIDFGARFIANGRQIIWTQFAPLRETDMGGGDSYEPSSTSIWIANADGTKARKLFGPDAPVGAGSYRLIVGGARSGTFSCDIGGGEVTLLGGAMLLALILLLAVRRSAR
jgi:hypothetical protein